MHFFPCTPVGLLLHEFLRKESTQSIPPTGRFTARTPQLSPGGFCCSPQDTHIFPQKKSVSPFAAALPGHLHEHLVASSGFRAKLTLTGKLSSQILKPTLRSSWGIAPVGSRFRLGSCLMHKRPKKNRV